jgi:hypothetical protein
MLILNFSHPLTAEQLAQIEGLTRKNEKITEVRDIPVQFDHTRPFVSQVTALVEACGLSAGEWQTTPLLIVPPALNFIAVALLAELHGLMGYFPACLRLRPVVGARPPRYEVAEILDLQTIRDEARRGRAAR